MNAGPRVAMLCCASLLAATARAQFAPGILVVPGRGVSKAAVADAEFVLGGVGSLSSSEQYLQSARDLELPPTSEEALQELGPAQYATLIVTLDPGRNALVVGLRDGRNAQLLGTLDVALAGRHLSEQGQADLAAAAEQALAAVRGAPAAAPRAAPHASQSRFPRPAAAPPEQPPPVLALDTEGEAAAAEEPSAEPFDGEFGVGLGVATRDVVLPTAIGDRKLSTGAHPVFELGVQGETALSSLFVLGVRAHYQSSVGLTAHETPAGGLPKDSALRSHHVHAGLLPGIRFTTSADAVRLQAFLGWGFSGLRAPDELSLPAFTAHGPILRPELRIPIAGDLVRLRLAPEVMLLANLSKDLRHEGDTSSTGISFGGEASLRVRIVKDSVAVEAGFRESHGSASTRWGASFTDTERLVTLRAMLQN